MLPKEYLHPNILNEKLRVFFLQKMKRGLTIAPKPTPPALQMVSRPQYILQFRPGTSHNANYEK